MSGLHNELSAVLNGLTGGHDVTPVMGQTLPITDDAFRHLSVEMLRILRVSPDDGSIRPGEPPTWFQLNSTDDDAELFVCRAEEDDTYYVLATRERS